jgi:F-type H+-transporting ATPase subunit a
MTLSVFAVVMSRRFQWAADGVQNFLEFAFEGILAFIDTITGEREQSRRFFPIVVTIFVFVLCSNLVEVVPGLGTIGLVSEHLPSEALAEEDGAVAGAEPAERSLGTGFLHFTKIKRIVPFLRSSSADLNVTIALALSAVVAVQVLGVASLGLKEYSQKFFFPPWKKPYLVGTFIGALEGVAELAKIVSFSFRLFGNIFAGEVLLLVMLILLPYGAPLPFLFLELFVGLVQAVVFSMLTLVFLKVATAHGAH